MTGYQEVLTDPSYRGQIVAMTYPLIGNYGTNSLDQESRSPHVRGFVIEELSEIPSNWRSEMSLDEYLKKWNIPGAQGIDTRALTRHLRTRGRNESLFDYGRDFARRSDAGGHQRRGRYRDGLRSRSFSARDLSMGPRGQTE
jgi:carbamoyl-phosphate synthase small subunit